MVLQVSPIVFYVTSHIKECVSMGCKTMFYDYNKEGTTMKFVETI